MRAFVFPGQGSQKIGMGRDLAETFPAARDVFNEVDDALDEKLSALIFEGSDDDLRLTENTQPALMAVSLAVVRALEAEFDIRLADHGSFVAGHSLGEYAALAAACPAPAGPSKRLHMGGVGFGHSQVRQLNLLEIVILHRPEHISPGGI